MVQEYQPVSEQDNPIVERCLLIQIVEPEQSTIIAVEFVIVMRISSRSTDIQAIASVIIVII